MRDREIFIKAGLSRLQAKKSSDYMMSIRALGLSISANDLIAIIQKSNQIKSMTQLMKEDEELGLYEDGKTK